LKHVLKYAIFTYIEKAISFSSAVISATVTFVIIHFSKDASKLNAATIFSTLELLQYIRINIIAFVGLGLTFFYD